MMYILGCFFSIIFTSYVYAQPFSFLNIGIGMTPDQIEANIKDSKDLIIRDDILTKQLVPKAPYTFVIKGNSTNQLMIKKIIVDLFENKSYQITIFFNEEYFSFYTLSEKLVSKYGIPQERSSFKAVWTPTLNTICSLTLEAPTIVKITDNNILTQVLKMQDKKLEEIKTKSFDYQERQRILNEL